jgi:hypothetical protein
MVYVEACVQKLHKLNFRSKLRDAKRQSSDLLRFAGQQKDFSSIFLNVVPPLRLVERGPLIWAKPCSSSLQGV